MAKFIGTPIRGTEFASVSDEAISAKVSADTQPRIRIDAGGRITWGSGSAGGDTNLYRDSANTLITDDIFKATSGLITLTTNGAPSDALPNGAIAVDTTNHVFYYRSNNTWNQVTAEGGNASLTVSDTPPIGAEAGDLWFESDTGKTFVYYDSFWVEIGSSSTTALASSITGNASTATTLETARIISITGDVSGSVSFDGSSNVTISTIIQPNSVALGTDTSGNYVSGVSAGTGISVSHTPSEGSTATISIESTAWTSYTPSLATNGGTITLGNGSSTGAYKLIGKTCHFRAKFTIGSTTSIGANEILIGLPVQAASTDYTFSGAALDNGNAWYEITGVGRYIGSTTQFAMIGKSTGTGSSSQGVSNTFPFSLLDGDYIVISGTYEAA